MTVIKAIARHIDDESGAITVDWVVLTAAIVGFVAVFMIAMTLNVQRSADHIDSNLEKASEVIGTLE